MTNENIEVDDRTNYCVINEDISNGNDSIIIGNEPMKICV